MSVENKVRERQEFERRIKEFLTLVASMSVDEIELALARLADQLSNSTDSGKVEKIKIKAQILSQYFNLRKSGAVKQVKFKRFISSLVGWSNLPQHPMLEKYQRERDARLEEWINKRRKMNWLKKCLTSDIPPNDQMPKYPIISNSEILIHSVVSYKIFNEKSALPEEIDAKKLIQYVPNQNS